MKAKNVLTEASRPPPRAGFTMIELLIVTAIMAVVIGTIGACLAAGIRVWERARTFNTLERDASIGLALIEKDLCNMLPIHAVGFEGARDTVRFPALLHGEDRRYIGSVEYGLDARGRTLVRRELSEQGVPVRRENLVANVTGLVMTYAGLQKAGGQGQKPSWNEQSFPATNFPQRVDLALSLEAGEQTFTLTRTILLPARR